MKRVRSFTLIELLVVISIIALLLAILIPSLSRARHAAKSAVCGSDLRGLMQAVYLYAGDFQDQLVGGGLSHGGIHGKEQGAWINTLRRHYGENALIARCPTDASEHWEVPIAPPAVMPIGGTHPDDEEPSPILRQTSYATNHSLFGTVAGRGPYNQMSMITRPARTLFMVELVEVGPFAVSDHVHPENWWSNPRVLASRELPLDRYLKRANYSLFDGHFEAHPFEETYAIDNRRSGLRTGIVWKKTHYDPEVAK